MHHRITHIIFCRTCTTCGLLQIRKLLTYVRANGNILSWELEVPRNRHHRRLLQERRRHHLLVRPLLRLVRIWEQQLATMPSKRKKASVPCTTATVCIAGTFAKRSLVRHFLIGPVAVSPCPRTMPWLRPNQQPQQHKRRRRLRLLPLRDVQ